MSNQSEETRQADFVLPPTIDATGLYGGTPNAVNLAASATAVVADLASLPPLSFLDKQDAAVDQNPLGHYLCFQARGSDMFLMFGASFASMTATQVSSAVMTAPGDGYGGAAPPTVTFSGGGGSVQATGHAVISPGGQIQQIVVDTPGSGYTSAPAIAITGGAGSGAAATAILGAPPSPAEANAVNGANGKITMAAGACIFLPQGGTASFKLPAGRTGRGRGLLSSHRFLGFVTAGGTGTLHVWQSSH